MENAKLLTYLIENGGILGMVVVGFVLSVGYYLRYLSANGSGSTPPRGEVEANAQIASKLNHVEERLNHIEHDLKARPTREEMHQIQIAMAKSDGKIDNLYALVKRTGEQVGRIEDFMINYAAHAKKDG